MSEQDIKIPNNHVIGLVHGEGAASAAAKDLRDHGHEEPVVLMGRSAAEKIDAGGENDSNPLTALVKSIASHFSEQEAYLQQYEEQARAGGTVLAVKVKDHDEAHEVKEIMEGHGVVNIRFFGLLAVADMTPGTNPSAVSDETPQ